MGSGHTGSPNSIPRAAISTDDGFRNSSAATFAFTCQFSGITISMVTLDFSESFPAE